MLEDHREAPPAELAQPRRWSALRMSSPSSRTSPAVGSISRVRQRTSVDLPLPDRPMTTKTSPGRTSNEHVADGDRRAGLAPQLVARQVGVRRPDRSCARPARRPSRGCGPRGSAWSRASRVGRSIVAVTRSSPLPNQPVAPGAVFCQMCFASRYSSGGAVEFGRLDPIGSSPSLPIPAFLSTVLAPPLPRGPSSALPPPPLSSLLHLRTLLLSRSPLLHSQRRIPTASVSASALPFAP